MNFEKLKTEFTLPDDPLLFLLRRSHNNNKEEEEEDNTLKEGILFLLAFIQANWLGPLTPIHQEGLKTLRNFDLLEELTSDGQIPYHLLRAPFFLHKSIAILTSLPSSPQQILWSHRAHFCWQRCLEGKSEYLRNTLLGSNENHISSPDVLFDLERAKVLIYYEKEKEAKILLEECSLKANFEHSFFGSLGRRTRFQSFDVSQLTLKASGGHSIGDSLLSNGVATQTKKIFEENEGPIDIALNDDHLLERPLLTNLISNERISFIGKSILLANSEFISTFNAKDQEVLAKASSILERIIPPPNESFHEDWSLLTHSLLLRSKLEEGINRKVERAAFQIEALVNQFFSKKVPFWERMTPFFFCVMVAMDWELDIHLASLFHSLGSYRSAAKVFEARGIWDRWIECMISLGENDRALSCLEAEISSSTGLKCAKLLCILGDLKNGDPSYYREAWKVSGERYPRSQLLLAIHHLKVNETDDAIVCLKKSLEINSLSLECWHLLGCAFLSKEDWKSSLQAFGRCVIINDDGEAWNNMCTCHLNLSREEGNSKHEEEAFSCLKEASKILSENSKTFGNLFRLSMHQGKFIEASLAYERLIDIHFKNGSRVPEIEDDLSGLRQLILALEGLSKRSGESKDFIRSLRKNIERILEGTLCTEMSMKPCYWKMCLFFSKSASLPLEEAIEFGFKALRSCDVGVGGQIEEIIDERIEIINSLEEDIIKLGCKEKLSQLEFLKTSLKDLIHAKSLKPKQNLKENKN